MSKAGLVWLAKGNGRRKIGKNKTVLKAVEMIRPYAKAAYFLMVVPKTPEKDILQELQDTNVQQQFDLQLRTTKRWGRLSLPVIFKFCEDKGHCSSFVHTLSIFEFNREQLAPTD